VREVVREPGEQGRDGDDPERLAALAQPEIPPGAHAEVIVEESNGTEPADQDDQRPPRARERH